MHKRTVFLHRMPDKVKLLAIVASLGEKFRESAPVHFERPACTRSTELKTDVVSKENEFVPSRRRHHPAVVLDTFEIFVQRNSPKASVMKVRDPLRAMLFFEKKVAGRDETFANLEKRECPFGKRQTKLLRQRREAGKRM